MNVLLLSPYPDRLRPVIEATSCRVMVTEEKISPEFLKDNKIDLGISYGYRHILKKDVLDVCPFINLHISYLPWNRGADPNIWSWVDDTPKGVTIHYIDEGIDTGDIIAQRETPMDKDETLATSYQKLQKDIEALFGEVWLSIYEGRAEARPQTREGSLHYSRDRDLIQPFLKNGYDIRACALTEMARVENISVKGLKYEKL
ncbi:MAG: formyl transferase [Rhodospirillales bacterium]|nr:formyl transferase [Rhodospirillales bacterium]